ncbi:MAG: DUF480 domain-containing protein [Thermoguttaceae bacterium]
MPEQSPLAPHESSAPRWQPLGPIDRRIAGVLVEKAKTTPESYPMSLNAIVNASNQKSNRHPVMQIEPDDAEEALERLRNLGAVGMIQGYGRVAKYRHYMYEWLGVDKVELAVMTELLLRGAQSEGELRGRASRMEPIADLTALRPVLASLKVKRLVIPLTPEGRGHIITHALYSPCELEHLRAQYASGSAAAMAADASNSEAPDAGPPVREGAAVRCEKPAAISHGSVPTPRRPDAPPEEEKDETLAAVRNQLEELRCQVSQLRSDLNDLTAVCEETSAELRKLRSELGA